MDQLPASGLQVPTQEPASAAQRSTSKKDGGEGQGTRRTERKMEVKNLSTVGRWPSSKEKEAGRKAGHAPNLPEPERRKQ